MSKHFKGKPKNRFNEQKVEKKEELL